MKRPIDWYSPKLSEEERRAIDSNLDRIAERHKGLRVTPTKSGKLELRPLKLEEPAPESPYQRWKRERAEKLARADAGGGDGSEKG